MAVMGLGVRMVGEGLRPDTLLFYRCALMLLVAGPAGLRSFSGASEVSRQSRLRFHALRGVFAMGGMICLYQALRTVPLAAVSVIAQSSLIWATIFSGIFLSERWTRFQAAFACVALFGLGICQWPGGNSFWVVSWTGVIFAFVGALFRGASLTSLRRLRRDFKASEIVLFLGLSGVLFLAPLQWWQPDWPSGPRLWQLVWMVAIVSTAGQWLMTVGFRYLKTLFASAIMLLGPVINLFLGFSFLGEWPGNWFFVGLPVFLFGMLGLISSQLRK